jgi:hypothetical protein
MDPSSLSSHLEWWQDEGFVIRWFMTVVELFPIYFLAKLIVLAAIKPRQFWKTILVSLGTAFIGVQALFFFYRLGLYSMIMSVTPSFIQIVLYVLLQVGIVSAIDAGMLRIGEELNRRRLIYFAMINLVLCCLNVPGFFIWTPIVPSQICDWFHLPHSDYLHIGDIMRALGIHR